MNLDRYLNIIIGPEPRFNLSDRILNAALFLSMLVGLITVSLDYFGDTTFQTKILSTGLLLFVIVLYLLSRKNPGLSAIKVAFLVFQFVGIIYIWMNFDGVSGTSNVYIISFLFIITLITRGTIRIALLALFFVIALFILFIELANPEIVVNYTTNRNENIDTFLSTLGISAGIVVMTLILIHSYSQKHKQVEELNRSKDTFLSIIAHDLKNPIATLTSLGEYLMMSDEQSDPATKKKLEEAIYHSSKNTYSLLENILLWARSEKGLIVPEIVDVNLNSILNDTILLLKEQAGAKKIVIINSLETEIIVKADKNMLNLVVRNLLSNAIKFTGSKGQILVCAEKDKKSRKANIFIRDNGIGIASNLLPTLFDLESTYKREGTNKESGTGLGLKLCKEFMDKQGGNIWVESDVDHGSTFFISLPCSHHGG